MESDSRRHEGPPRLRLDEATPNLCPDLALTQVQINAVKADPAFLAKIDDASVLTPGTMALTISASVSYKLRAVDNFVLGDVMEGE